MAVDQALEFLSLDLLQHVLELAGQPEQAGRALIEQVRELSGARLVVLLEHGEDGALRATTASPARRAALLAEPAVAALLSAIAHQSSTAAWEPGAQDAAALEAHQLAHSLAVPLLAGDRRVGSLVLLGISFTGHMASLRRTMEMLSRAFGLILRNANFHREAERLVDERTDELQRALSALQALNAELDERVAARTADLAEANARLDRMAQEDALTGIANRRRFNQAIDEEVRRACRSGRPLSLIMLDVDYFKRYNDHYGHQAGDRCLQVIGEVLRACFRRAGELPARYGGEEFAVLLPDTPLERAEALAEQLRRAIADRAIPHAASDAASVVSASLGVTGGTLTPEIGVTQLIDQADQALYQSKQHGRNRVTVAPGGAV